MDSTWPIVSVLCLSSGMFEISEASGVRPGTKIIIHLKADNREFASEARVRGKWEPEPLRVWVWVGGVHTYLCMSACSGTRSCRAEAPVCLCLHPLGSLVRLSMLQKHLTHKAGCFCAVVFLCPY